MTKETNPPAPLALSSSEAPSLSLSAPSTAARRLPTLSSRPMMIEEGRHFDFVEIRGGAWQIHQRVGRCGKLRVRQADPGLCAMPRLLLVKTPIYCRDIVSYMWNKRPCGPLHFVTDLLPAASLTHGTFLG